MTRKPDYRVAAMNKVTDEKNSNVGGAWVNEDGSISVILDSFVVLPVGGRHLLITLFPITEKLPTAKRKKV